MKNVTAVLEFLTRKVLSMLLTVALLGLVVSQVMHDEQMTQVFVYAAGAFFALLFFALVALTYIRTKYLGEADDADSGS